MRRLSHRCSAALEFISAPPGIGGVGQAPSRRPFPTAKASHAPTRGFGLRGTLPRHPLTRNAKVKLVEPPSCSCPSPIVFIGRTRRAQWVAGEQNVLFGALFVSRAQAVKYALFENGHH